MSENIVERKFYRTPDGKPATVTVVVDQDQEPSNPRHSEATGALMLTWERDYVSPDDPSRVLPDELDAAVSQWAGTSDVDADRLVRYVRISHTDSIVYIGALSRNNGDGSMSVNDYPRPGEHHDGIVLVTILSWKLSHGANTPPDVETARKLAHFEVKRYSEWATGEVYGYVVEVGGEVTDSVWGYIGDDKIPYMLSQGFAELPDGSEEIDEADYDGLLVA